MHVLELAQALGLTAAQRATAEMLRARMLAEARVLGARIVVLEEELDALFAGAAADAGRLAAITTALGALGGRLREVHLATHIDMRDAWMRRSAKPTRACAAIARRRRWDPASPTSL